MDRIVSFKTGLQAKEIGYRESVQNRYVKDGILNHDGQVRYGYPSDYNDPCFQDVGRSYTSAPTQSELRSWLREECDMDIVITPSFDCYNITQISKFDGFTDKNTNIDLEGLDFKDFTSYEEALETALSVTIDKYKNEK